MPQPGGSSSNYCDIQSPDPRRCIEIDLFEGNTKALQTTLHTDKGKAADGRCNQWGCAQRFGFGDDNCKYGLGSPNFDTARPFEMAVKFDEDGVMTVDGEQDGIWRRLWDAEHAGNNAAQVPQQAFGKVKQAMQQGVVLVASMWGRDDGSMSWLDGGCNRAYPQCDLNSATAIFSDFRIEASMGSASRSVPLSLPSARPPHVPPPWHSNSNSTSPLHSPPAATLASPLASLPKTKLTPAVPSLHAASPVVPPASSPVTQAKVAALPARATKDSVVTNAATTDDQRLQVAGPLAQQAGSAASLSGSTGDDSQGQKNKVDGAISLVQERTMRTPTTSYLLLLLGMSLVSGFFIGSVVMARVGVRRPGSGPGPGIETWAQESQTCSTTLDMSSCAAGAVHEASALEPGKEEAAEGLLKKGCSSNDEKSE